MKDNFEHVEIEPEHCYLDFIGPAKPEGMGRSLKGTVKLTVSKAVKIRSIHIKFKGYGRICLKNSGGTVLDIETNLLPKIKAPLVIDNKKTFQLPPGEHTIPWELQIPNVYPRSLMIKRAAIHYKVELAISLGLGKKAITAEYPIVILRHLLPCKELSPLVGSRVYRQTVPGKFHYEIDCPRVVCLEQGSMPVALKYLCIADQKPVISVRTQLLQVEFYRCETISKSDANLEFMEKEVQSSVFGQRYADAMRTNPKCVKFTRRKGSAFIHSVEDNPISAWKRFVVVRHELDELLTYGIESPTVTIYHQLEVIFQFGQKHDVIRAKVPVIITSLPYKNSSSSPLNSPMMPTASALVGGGGDDIENFPKYRMETLPHFTPSRVLVDGATSSSNDIGKGHRRTSTATSSDDTSSISSVAPDIARERNIFMGVRERALSVNNNTSKPTIVPPASRAGPALQLSVAASSIDLSSHNYQSTKEISNSTSNQPASPSLSLSAFGGPNSIRRSASASNLSTFGRSSQPNSPPPPSPTGRQLHPPQRPSRSPMRRPIPNLAVNTALANTMLNRGPLSDDIVSAASSSSRRDSIASSEALPLVDRNLLRSKAMWMNRFEPSYASRHHLLQATVVASSSRNGSVLSRAAPSSGINGRSYTSHHHQQRRGGRQQQQQQGVIAAPTPPPPTIPAFARVVDPWLQVLNQEYENDSDEDVYGDDEMSVSTMDATSLSSVTTGSGADELSLLSRPPSPVYSPAPGLPGAIALRPQQASPVALVEESFACSPHSVSANSVPYTVASSSVLSPRTSYALYRQRIARAPPLPPPAVPLPEEPQSPTTHIVNNINNTQGSKSYTADVHNHYSRAELPPLPPSEDDEQGIYDEDDCARTGSRYFDDSDDEPSAPVCTCPQHGHVLLPPQSMEKQQQRQEQEQVGTPPQLPRLSLGSTFSASLSLK